MPSNRSRNTHVPGTHGCHSRLLVLLVLFAAACTGHFIPGDGRSVDPVKGPGFVIVTAGPQDTLASLAAKYLEDERKGWWIATYNGVDTVTAGQRLVIPLEPVVYGGLTTTGYQTVPILLYDQLAETPKTPRITSPSTFERQLRYLSENGYTTITLDQLYAFLELEDQIPAKAVVITFDSVGTWVYELAFPLLKAHGMTAAVFIATEKIDQPGNLTWSQLAEMAAAGFDIGSLGRSGDDPAVLKPGENGDTYIKRLESEIVTAGQAIAKHTSCAGYYFAYPGGDTNDLVTALLKKHGIRMAFTRKRGTNAFFVDNFKLRRSLIYGDYDLGQFQQNVAAFQPAELR
jgi:peptidoglycan/xylan/chitin deacetylase (PgdA/CDA1 family)